MRDDLFSIPIRKYHLDDNKEQFVSFVESYYNNGKFEEPSPYLKMIEQLPPWMVPVYSDLIEGFLNDLKCSKTHVAVITSATINVLDKGESMDRVNTLPSHYTATHYISDNQSQSDIFYHPAKTLIEPFNPGLDEWVSGAGFYVTHGDVIIHPSFIEYSTPVRDTKRMTITLTLNLQKEDERDRESSN